MLFSIRLTSWGEINLYCTPHPVKKFQINNLMNLIQVHMILRYVDIH